MNKGDQERIEVQVAVEEDEGGEKEPGKHVFCQALCPTLH